MFGDNLVVTTWGGGVILVSVGRDQECCQTAYTPPKAKNYSAPVAVVLKLRNSDR